MSRRSVFLLSECVILVAASIAHGLRTDRWGTSTDVAAAASALDRLPMRIGDWDGANVDLPIEQIKAARLAGLTARKYTHRYTGSEITVMVVCGRPGPVAVHTPDVCYQGAGFVMGAVKAEDLCDGNTVWASTFTKGSARPTALRIRWGWSTGGAWKASNSPRVEFARAGVLYKIYLIRSAPSEDAAKDRDQERDFDFELIPSLQQIIG